MTQAEYIAQHGAPADKMHSAAEFRALLETAREENPFATMTGPDEVSTVKLAGAAVGWAECLKWLKSANKAKPTPAPKVPARAYADPEQNLLPKSTENKKP